ncbi:MAG: methyltransferase domain-containing protein [Deltaproteobacteria bacterium]|nr:methyltransferase domain-containing protein [Deltaproteobacteria bacterium]
MNAEQSVLERYSNGAGQREESLCCPVEYDKRYLEVIPAEVLERDYGCGDPSAYVGAGETVLDLGSGSGKICFIAAQVVGPGGRIIGVDMNPDMLALARRHQPEVAARVGYDNVRFVRAKIQDLRTDLDAMDRDLARRPIRSQSELAAFEETSREQRETRPLVADGSIDVVVSNCVLNLVRDDDKQRLLGEIFRVLRRGGRAVISDIVSDEPVPADLKQDPQLWSGCISGAFEESAFLQAFVDAGFHGVEIVKRDAAPWRTVNGIEFRSVTVRAWKGKQGACQDHNQAVIYRGPWSEVRDDDGHVLERGVPMAVCEKTFRIYTSEPYAAEIIPVPPRTPVEAEDAKPFDCSRDTIRLARETKGLAYDFTTAARSACDDESCC